MTRLRIKRHDEPRAARTPAQEAASGRNFRIFQLRGLYSFAHMLTGQRRELLRDLVDEELASLGAKSETERRAELRSQWERVDGVQSSDDFAEVSPCR